MEFTKEELEVIWCAGFYDGEGCTTFHNGSIRIDIGQKDPNLLFKFNDAMGGMGRFSKDMFNYHLVFTRYYSVVSVIHILWQWLGIIKQNQIKKAIKHYKDYHKFNPVTKLHYEFICNKGHDTRVLGKYNEGKYNSRCAQCKRDGEKQRRLKRVKERQDGKIKFYNLDSDTELEVVKI